MIKYNAAEIIMKLNGPINPTGESNEDKKRNDNLKSLIQIVNNLLIEIDGLRDYKNRVEYSMKKIGQEAQTFMEEIHDNFNPYIK